MTAEIEVLQPGLFSTIQDLGRRGYLKYGVPLSGAMDLYAAKTANLLLQNAANDAVLEITQLGPKLKFGGRSQISITGADLSPKINGIPVTNNVGLDLGAGDVLSFGKRNYGCRAYVAIKGGFKGEKIMGSRSWYEGISEQSRLERGMNLSFDPVDSKLVPTNASLKTDTTYLEQQKVSVYPGPEFESLSQDQKEWLQKTILSVGKNNNRMAIQLEEGLKNDLKPIITGPVLPGTIQLTPSGTMIILMRDCQTTGGYPRILQVSEKGMNTLAQKVVGDIINFELKVYED